MLDGKRGTAASIVYGAFEQIKEATGNDALEVFETAMDNIMPVLEVRARRVGGSDVYKRQVLILRDSFLLKDPHQFVSVGLLFSDLLYE